MSVLAAITGIVSYLHGLWVVRDVGNHGVIAYLIPCVPDLMIVTSSITMLDAAATGHKRPRLAMVSLGVGIAWTVAMNVAAGYHDGGGSALIAGLIPVAFVLTFETLVLWIRQDQPVPLTDDANPDCGHKVATSLDEALLAAVAVMSQREAADAFGVHRNKVGQLVRAALAGTDQPDTPPNGSDPA